MDMQDDLDREPTDAEVVLGVVLVVVMAVAVWKFLDWAAE
jgi:hypothetical protein